MLLHKYNLRDDVITHLTTPPPPSSTAVTNAVDGMMQARHAARTVDLQSLSPSVASIADPVSERRRQIALQVILLLHLFSHF